MSVKLDEYKEEIRVGRQREILSGRRAFRLDQMEDPKAKGRDLRADVGLDGLSCCDYLRMGNKGAILMEETDLAETMRGIEEDLDRVRGGGDARKKFIRDTVRERVVREHARKVYGSLLLMCRAGVLWKDTRHIVWIVVDGDSAATSAIRRMDPENELADALNAVLVGDSERQSSLQGGLRSAKLVDQAEVITISELKKRLPGPD